MFLSCDLKKKRKFENYLKGKIFPFLTSHSLLLPCGRACRIHNQLFHTLFYSFDKNVGQMTFPFFLFTSLKNKICFQINFVAELAIIEGD